MEIYKAHPFQENMEQLPYFRKVVIKTVLGYILDAEDHGRKQRKKRERTPETLNRYVFCLNKITELQIVSMNELINFILKDLEGGFGITIARKTLKKIVGALAKHELINMASFPVNPNANEADKGCLRYILFSPEIDKNDSRIAAKVASENRKQESRNEEKKPRREIKAEEPEISLLFSPNIPENAFEKMEKILLHRHLRKGIRAFKALITEKLLKSKLQHFVASPLPELFAKLQIKSSLNNCELWRKTPLPRVKASTKQKSISSFKRYCDMVQNFNKKEKKNHAMFDTLMEQLKQDRDYCPETPLIPMLKKWSTSINSLNASSNGLQALEILHAHGELDIASCFLPDPEPIFSEAEPILPTLNDFMNGSPLPTGIDSFEFLAELRREELILRLTSFRPTH